MKVQKYHKGDHVRVLSDPTEGKPEVVIKRIEYHDGNFQYFFDYEKNEYWEYENAFEPCQ